MKAKKNSSPKLKKKLENRITLICDKNDLIQITIAILFGTSLALLDNYLTFFAKSNEESRSLLREDLKTFSAITNISVTTMDSLHDYLFDTIKSSRYYARQLNTPMDFDDVHKRFIVDHSQSNNDLIDNIERKLCEIIHRHTFSGMLENLGYGIQVEATKLVEKICTGQKCNHHIN